jgi:hypothetical protein
MNPSSSFLFLLLAVISVFNFLLSELIILKKKRNAKEFFPDAALVSKQAFFCCLNLKIVLQSAVLWLFLPQ